MATVSVLISAVSVMATAMVTAQRSEMDLLLHLRSRYPE
jgi:hypothetical protein